MYDYSTLIEEVRTTNFLLNEQNSYITSLNENILTFYSLVFSIGVLIVVNIIHHLFDALYKRK